MEIRHINHLYWRACFGPDLSQLERLSKMKKNAVADEIFSDAQPFDPIDIATKPQHTRKDIREMDKDEKNALRKFNFEELIDINITWMNYLAFSKEQFRERMALFWHDHFACFVPYSYMMQLHINKLRQHALGSFRDLLFAIAKDAAMLQFLNNLQNKKLHPNENFAREVMELYTLGIGNYTENDIKEAAKAFTGWAFDEDGNFFMREKQHDYGPKTFLGKTGDFSGEDILNMLLAEKQTARFITRKIYAYFVNENPDEEKIMQLADEFYASDYDIPKLMRSIFLSDWFYDEKNIGSKIKSPIDLITGMRRSFGIEFSDEQVLLFMQGILGQTLGYPPNVAGWPDGKPWIDSSTLIFRMKLGDTIFNNSDIGIEDKDQAEGLKLGKKFRNFGAKVEMQHIFRLTENLPPQKAKELLVSYFIQPQNRFAERLAVKDIGSMTEYTYNCIIQLLRQPEYQLC